MKTSRNLALPQILLAVLGLVLSSACAGSAPPPICQPRAAWDTGRNQALSGQALNYQVGAMCQGESHGTFQQQLHAGYTEGLKQYCMPAMVQQHGQAQGRTGAAAAYDPRRYSICTRQDGFAQAYQTGHQAGVAEYCVPTTAARAGYDSGLKGLAAQFDSRPFAICPAQALEQMAIKYQKTHAQGVAEFCGQAANQARAQGLAIGRQGQSASLDTRAYALCSLPAISAAYAEGAQAGLAEYCNPANAAAAGQELGLSGAASSYDPRPYQACSSRQQRDIRLSYNQSYGRGMDNYCQGIVQSTVSQSRQLGAAGQPNLQNNRYGNCPRATVARARAASSQAYGQGLGQYCAAPNIESVGQALGRQGKLGGDAALGKYRICTPRLYSAILARFQRGADTGLAVFCGDDQLRRSAQQIAQTSNRGRLPQAFGVCLRRYPDTSRAFQQIVMQERERIISTQCTFQRGEAQGRRDARASNRKQTNIPAFCDRTAFNVYLSGYLDGWKNKKGNICSATDAYQRGQSDANAGRASSYRAPNLCRNQTSQLSNSYLQGYRDATRVLQDQRQRDRLNQDRQRDRDRNDPNWRERERQRKIIERHTQAKRNAYSVCLRKGYGPSSCNQVTNRVCLEKGYGPSSCNLPTLYLGAVNMCLNKGYSPSSCPNVTSIRCLEKGYSPSSCALTNPNVKAVNMCFDKGYSPSSCNGATNYECLRQGHSPSSCR